MRAMDTWVISLAQAQERRAFQRQQLQALGLTAVFFDATQREQVAPHLQGLRSDAWERVLMPTELACFASHYRVWQQVAQRQAPVLVLEDDAMLSTRSVQFLRSLPSLQGIDHLSLETRLRHKLLGPVEPLAGAAADMGVARLFQDRTGAAAYVLWPSGAQRLVSKAQRCGVALADAFIANDAGLRSYQAVPPMAFQADIAQFYGVPEPLNTVSYIQAHGPRANFQSAPKSVLLRMKVRRLRAQLLQVGRWLAALGRARRQRLGPDPLGFVFSQAPKQP